MLGIGIAPGARPAALADGAAATIPGAFAPGDWTLDDAGTGGTLTVGVLALPVSGGAPVEAVEASVDGGGWTALGGGTPGTHAMAGLTDGATHAVALRAVNRVGPGPGSEPKAAVPTTGTGGGSGAVPAAFAAADWTLADTGAGTLALSVLDERFPAQGDGPVDRLEIRRDGGGWETLAAVAAPAAFAAADWTVTDAGDGTLTLSTLALPADGGLDIIRCEVRVDGGPWQALSEAA